MPASKQPRLSTSGVRKPDPKNPRLQYAATFGATVRRLRLERDLSIAEVGWKTGIAESNLTNLEHGKHSPRLKTLQKLAKAFDVPVEELL